MKKINKDIIKESIKESGKKIKGKFKSSKEDFQINKGKVKEKLGTNREKFVEKKNVLKENIKDGAKSIKRNAIDKKNNFVESRKEDLKKVIREGSDNLYSFQISLSDNVDNKDIMELAKGLYEYIPLGQRLNKKGDFNSLMFNYHQTCWEMVINKGNINFNIHTKSNPLKIENIYKRYYPSCHFKKLDTLEEATKDDYIIEYNLKEHYFKSLNIDTKHLQPIASMMDLQLMLEEDEQIIFDIIITSAEANWGENAEVAKKEFKVKEESLIKMPKELNVTEVLKAGINLIGVGLTTGINAITDYIFEDAEQIELTPHKNIKLSEATNMKSKYPAFKTTIRAIIKSQDNSRREVLKQLIDNALTFVDGDNQLIGEVIQRKEKTYILDNQNQFLNKVNRREPDNDLTNDNILTVKEIGKLIMLPTKNLQEKFFTNKTVTTPNTNILSSELFEGGVGIGTLVTDKKEMTYYPRKEDLYCLPKIIAGGMGSGKSNFTIGFAQDSYKVGNTVFLFDYIDNCQIASATKSLIKDHLVIEPSEMLNFSFPEIEYSDKPIYKKALDYVNCVVSLLDTVNIKNAQDMTSRMKKTLRGAGVVGYLTNRRNIKDIHRILTNMDYREEAISEVDAENKDRFSVYITMLEGLTVEKKKELVNDDDAIKYLLDRFEAIMGDGNLLDIYTNTTSDINFQELIDSGKLITIELPQNLYRHKWVKDVVVCYLLQRIWIALENRPSGQRKIVDIILDEVHQLTNTKTLLATFACETRKFRLGFLFCCQYFSQFQTLLDSVEGGTVHYVILQGSKISNFEHVEPLVSEDFTVKNFLSLPKYHSMNLIQTSEGCQTFVTSNPKYY